MPDPPPAREPTPGPWVHLGAPEAVICDGPGVCTVAEGRHVSVLDLEERLRRAEEEQNRLTLDLRDAAGTLLRAERERDAAREVVHRLAEVLRLARRYVEMRAGEGHIRAEAVLNRIDATLGEVRDG